MIIEARAGGGSFGDVGLPIEGSGRSVVFHSLARNQEFRTGTLSVFSANQSNFAIASIIYDPKSGDANQSLPVTVSIAGLYGSNGTVRPLPPWLQFSVPQSSTNLSLKPYGPLYFALDFTTTNAAPLGVYTLVVNVQVGGGTLTLFIPVDVGPPIYT